MKMPSLWLLHLIFVPIVFCGLEDELKITTTTRTLSLEKYESYQDAYMVHLEVPDDSLFVSFKFVVEEINLSIFPCKETNVTLALKYGSLPVVNPDGSIFPDTFKNITRPDVYIMEFPTNEMRYFNMTTPKAGSYYVAAYLPYSDPKYDAIQQQGLIPQCYRYIDTTVYVQRAKNLEIIVENQEIDYNPTTNSITYYKFYVPTSTDHVLLITKESSFQDISVRFQPHTLPSNSTTDHLITNNSALYFPVEQCNWYFIEFLSNETDAHLLFELKYIPITFSNQTFEERTTNDLTLPFYHQYNLLRKPLVQTLIFTYELETEIRKKRAVGINVTSSIPAILKFHINDLLDVGGTLAVTIAFKPRVTASRTIESEPMGHTVIGCVGPYNIETPTWPNHCVHEDAINSAPLFLNHTTTNTTVLIPFPDGGDWYATFQLFCGECLPCDCPDACRKIFGTCRTDCEVSCDGNVTCIQSCAEDCVTIVLEKSKCAGCDCVGSCSKNATEECNSTLIFDVSSFPCVSGSCGSNGRCTFLELDNVIYSTCACSNNYRGWGCTDDTNANPYWLVWLALLLLVLSNLAFLPAVYIAYRRRYYTEAIVYFAICFFSTFYHACDAGENIISFCITRLSALQFADFFCALLAIWVTLIAIADLPSFWPSICQMSGAILLAVVISIDKTSLWAFVVPSVCGILVVVGSWYAKYRRRRAAFLSKKYMYVYVPCGTVLVIIALTIFGLLQTEDNYKYLHSLWHILMAVSVMLLLPMRNAFQPVAAL